MRYRDDTPVTFEEMCEDCLLEQMKTLSGSEPESEEYWVRALGEEYLSRILPDLFLQARRLQERYMALQAVRRTLSDNNYI